MPKSAEMAFFEGSWHYIFQNGIFSIVVTKFCLCSKKNTGKSRLTFLAAAVCSKYHFWAKFLASSPPIFLAGLLAALKSLFTFSRGQQLTACSGDPRPSASTPTPTAAPSPWPPPARATGPWRTSSPRSDQYCCPSRTGSLYRYAVFAIYSRTRIIVVRIIVICG